MKKFGLIGYPLSHSFSKKYFTQKFKDQHIESCEYELYPIESIEMFPSLISQIGPDLIGLNCTIPYKQSVIPYLDELSDDARAIQAVNTIQFKNGKRFGFNSDIPGFRSSLEKFIPSDIQHALVLGSGGAAKAVFYVLKQMGISYTTVTRSPTAHSILYSDLNHDLLQNSKLIINTTPLGMTPHVDTCPDIDYQALTDRHYLYDLVYNPEKTLFLQKGESRGAQILNGLSMLYAQAEVSWKIWNE